EFLMVSGDDGLAGEIASFLLWLATDTVADGDALLRGEVVDVSSPVVRGSAMTGVYATSPVMFPEAFEVYDACEPPIVFAWLLPVCGSEIDFVEKNGWSAFEDIVSVADADLFDVMRTPLV
ncbi:MAG TPA: suppressor of fused domain protein, partial [Gammaproteobacteria bacterium]